MNLSKDLISRFVKITNDKQEVKKETITYGTVAEDESGVYIDGSDTITPISKTADVKKNDRVIVMIKNHEATIIGNLTSPAASVVSVNGAIEDIVSESVNTKTAEITEKLTAAEADIDTLQAERVTINDILEAHSADILYLKSNGADIGDLSATFATIKQLDATNAYIHNLEGTYSDFIRTTTDKLNANEAAIDNLESNKADINELNAATAKVDNLDANVASINTMIFGSATGTVIQTSFANAVIAQLGDAQIKSAMIESVSASKITAGDIITNNIRVKSADGSLIISDETMLISDGTYVRVQIGKDAANDYSINVWDADGNLMFSQGGITDAAIKEAIIRDDMVSDTANIHASKLDIDSLFEEINDSSNTIKSTKVYLDEEGQTLDVAFKSLTTEVTDQGKTISSQGTAISTIQGQISSKIWQQDINTAKDEMSTEYSTLEQNLDSFQTTVGETYATKTSLTDTYNRTIHKSGTIDLTGDEYDADTYYPVVGNIMPYDGYRHVAVNVQLNSGSKPSWSTNDGGFTCNVSVRMKAGGWGTVDANTLGWIDDFTYNFCDKMPAYIHQNRNASKPVLYLRGGGRYFVFTDYDASWTIYTEDYTQSNTTFSPTTNPSNSPNLVDNWKTVYRVSTAESNITQLSDRITSNVTETTNLGKRMSTIEQTAEGLSVEIANLEIGGRNYILSSATMAGGAASNGITLTHQDDGSIKVVTTSGNGNWHSWYQPSVANANLSDGDEFTFSVDVKCDEGSTGKPKIYIKNGMGYCAMQGTATTEYTRLYYTGTWVSTNDVRFHFGWNETVGTFYVRRPKLEKGNRCTDWAPAPEDIESDILDASKTATNYLNFSSSGLVIGDLTSSTLGKNVLIDSDSVDIRNGTTTLASFGADYLYLAKNSKTATIDMCDGLAKLYHSMDGSYSQFVIDTTNYNLSSAKVLSTRYIPLTIETTAANTDNIVVKSIINGVTVGGFGMNADGYMVRYGSELAENVVTANPPIILDTDNFATMMDGNWQYGGVLGTNFTIYANDTQVQYRKIGKIVHIRGAVKPTTDIAGSTTSYTIFTLPEGYRPSVPVYARCQGSAANTWLLSVTATGAVRFSRYGYGTTYVTATAGTWLPFDVTFFID